jgi:predicted ATP-grasp superfamily ATP-dependent carboligase
MVEALVCLLGDLDLVYPLVMGGFGVAVGGNTLPEVRWSRHTTSCFDLPSPWREPEAAVARLTEFARTQRQRPALVYQTDAALLMVSRHRDALAEHFDFIIPEAHLVEDLLDKRRFASLIQRVGLPAPHTLVALGGENPGDLDALTYPVIVKPAVRDEGDRWGAVAAAAKAVRCQSAEDLALLLSEPSLAGMVVLAQDEIVGDEDQIFSYHAWIDDDGNTRAEFIGRKIRTWPAQFGVSTAVEIIDDSEVAHAGRTTLKAIEFTGVVKIDFKRDPAGNLLVLEINPRFSLWHHPGAKAGVNIPAMVVDHLRGRPVAQHQPTTGVRWCNPWKDVVAAHRQGVSLIQWLRFLRTTDACYAAELDDPLSTLGWFVPRLDSAVRGRFTHASA